jgi:hypothetical protein
LAPATSAQLRFLGMAALVNAAVALITRVNHSPAVAVAGACDMILTVSALYWWMVVRPGFRPKGSVLAIAFLGLLRASFAFPAVVPGKFWIGAAAEIGLIAAVATGWRKFLPPAVARAVAGELSVFYYAFAWRAKPDIPAGSAPFTLHRKNEMPGLFYCVGLVSLLEIVPVHLVLARWSHGWAWGLTALSLYGMLWMIAVARSFELRPCYVTEEECVIRCGLLFSVRIPRSAIASVSRERIEGARAVPRRVEPTWFLRFHEPIEAERILGFATKIDALAIAPDDDTQLNWISMI